MNDLEKVCKVIVDFPVAAQLQNVGHFYRSHALQRTGSSEECREAILRVVDNIIPDCRARTILQLADSYYTEGDLKESAALCIEAARAASADKDLLTRCQALRQLAIIRAVEGDHTGALSDLERLLRVTRWISRCYAPEYYAHLNSLAVELGEVGKIEEANHAVDFALASPFAPGYPQWQETKLDLASRPKRTFAPMVFAIGSWHHVPESSRHHQESRPSPKVALLETKPFGSVNAVRKAASIRAKPIQTSNYLGSSECTCEIPALSLVLRESSALFGYIPSPQARAPPHPSSCLDTQF